MKTIILQKVDGTEIEVPSIIEFEGSDKTGSIIWYFDEHEEKHSYVVKETPDQIKELTKI